MKIKRRIQRPKPSIKTSRFLCKKLSFFRDFLAKKKNKSHKTHTQTHDTMPTSETETWVYQTLLKQKTHTRKGYKTSTGTGKKKKKNVFGLFCFFKLHRNHTTFYSYRHFMHSTAGEGEKMR